MKTQFVVTVTQTGDGEKITPAVMRQVLRNAACEKFIDEHTTVTVRHMVEDQPASAPPDLIAAGALRQYAHNDGSEGLVAGYDKEITDRVFAGLTAAPAAVDRTALAALLRDAHRAGQKAGRMIGKDGADAAIAYAKSVLP